MCVARVKYYQLTSAPLPFSKTLVLYWGDNKPVGSPEGAYDMAADRAKKDVDTIIHSLCVLVIDDNQYMRKTVRTLLINCGIKDVYEAADGITALDIIRTLGPDLLILDWEMPFLNGAELIRIVRSPGTFPVPDIPIIMLTGHCERWRVLEAARLGVNEFLTKPVSAKSLYDRILSIVIRPRPAVQLGAYYGPQPRKFMPADVVQTDKATSPPTR